MQKNEVYIIIVTYNGMKWLARCLESTKPYPVIVVDNNSTDGTIDYIKSHYPEIILFEQKENLGFGRANNIGISYALNQGADYVFLLNQDAYIVEDCIRKLVQMAEENKNFGTLSPIHLNGTGTRLDRNFSYSLSFDKNSQFYSDFVIGNKRKNVYRVPFVNAAAWLISKNILHIIGGFDPIFFHYGEDVNFCQRLRYAKYSIGIVPDVFICHDREFRSKNNFEKYSSEYYAEMENNFKISNGDLNNSKYLKNINKQKESLKRKMIFSIMKGNIKNYKIYKKEFLLIKNNTQKLKYSRSYNKKFLSSNAIFNDYIIG